MGSDSLARFTLGPVNRRRPHSVSTRLAPLPGAPRAEPTGHHQPKERAFERPITDERFDASTRPKHAWTDRQGVQRRNLKINRARTSTSTKIMELETSPTRAASMKLADVLGMVAGSMKATNTTPKISGRTRPVTAAVLCIVNTRPMIRPMRKGSVNCERARSVKAASPLPHVRVALPPHD